MGVADDVNDEAGTPRGPNGEELTRERRLTYRRARPWLERSNVRIGVAPCGSNVRWIQDEERQPHVQQLRQAEGRDCNVAGDVLLYSDSEGAKALVVEDPYSLLGSLQSSLSVSSRRYRRRRRRWFARRR